MRLSAIALAVICLLGVTPSRVQADHGWDRGESLSLGYVTVAGHHGYPGYHNGYYRHFGYRPGPVVVVPLLPVPPVRVYPHHPPVYRGYRSWDYPYGRDRFDFHYRGRNFGFSFGF